MVEILDFYADWCGPCHATKPIIAELEKEYSKNANVKFTKVDVDKEQELAGKYGVMSIPTFVILNDNKEVDRKVGAMPRDSMRSWITSFINK